MKAHIQPIVFSARNRRRPRHVRWDRVVILLALVLFWSVAIYLSTL